MSTVYLHETLSSCEVHSIMFPLKLIFQQQLWFQLSCLQNVENCFLHFIQRVENQFTYISRDIKALQECAKTNKRMKILLVYVWGKWRVKNFPGESQNMKSPQVKTIKNADLYHKFSLKFRKRFKLTSLCLRGELKDLQSIQRYFDLKISCLKFLLGHFRLEKRYYGCQE